jgi:hypothetical protein
MFFPLMTVSGDTTMISEDQAFYLSHDITEDQETSAR